MSIEAYVKLADAHDGTALEKIMALLWGINCIELDPDRTPENSTQLYNTLSDRLTKIIDNQNGAPARVVHTAQARFRDVANSDIVVELRPQFTDILGDRDLLGLINMGAPKDEYSPEVLPIIVWLTLHPECQLDELIVAIKKVFDVMFDSSAAHITEEQYGGVAQTLSIVWRLWYLRWEKEQWETEFLADAAECLKEVKDAADDRRRINHSRDALGWLVQHYPEKLLSWIREEQLRPEDLTFAAELAGSIPVGLGSQDVLVILLQHPEALVREGAVLGLWRQAPLPENILVMLRGLAVHDGSNAVKKTVFDVLEDHEN